MSTLEDRLRHSLQRTAQDTDIPPPPTLPVPTSTLANATDRRRAAAPRRRRRTALLLVAAAVPVTGALAAAGGRLPDSLEAHFSFSDRDAPGDSRLARAGVVPGPAGQRFELWTRSGGSGQTCFLSALVPDDQPEDRPAQQVRSSSGFCDSAADGASRRFGSTGGGSDTTFTYVAGPAVRAEVRLTDGRRWPAVVAAGQIAGWVPPDRRGEAVLVGYDSSGKVLGQIDLTPWDPPPHLVDGDQ